VDYSINPPSGYRFVYVDELLQYSDYREAIFGYIENYPGNGLIALINGFTDGSEI
jgi:hypothetical protein